MSREPLPVRRLRFQPAPASTGKPGAVGSANWEPASCPATDSASTNSAGKMGRESATSLPAAVVFTWRSSVSRNRSDRFWMVLRGSATVTTTSRSRQRASARARRISPPRTLLMNRCDRLTGTGKWSCWDVHSIAFPTAMPSVELVSAVEDPEPGGHAGSGGLLLRCDRATGRSSANRRDTIRHTLL